MAYYLAQASGLLNGDFPWSVNSLLSSNNTESSVAASFDAAFRAIWTNATLAPYIPTTVTINATSVSTATSEFKQTTKTTTIATTAGTSTSIALPYHTCEIITWRTPYATKWGRGRWYLPPLAVNALDTDGFSILAAAQTAIKDGMNAYFASVGSAYTHQIKHIKETKGGTRLPFSADQVSAADIPATFAVQRRRADKLVPSRISITI